MRHGGGKKKKKERKKTNVSSCCQFYTKAGERIVLGTPYEERRDYLSIKMGEDRLYTLEKDARRHFNFIYEIPFNSMASLIQPDAEVATDGDADGQYAATVIDTPPTITCRNPNATFSQTSPMAFFSSASLEGILNVHVFTVSQNKFCKGILIEYENGSKRALGQCRLGLDQVQSWHRPLSMHYMPVEYERNVGDLVNETRTSKGAHVTFDCESSRISEDGSMEENYYALKGRLNFWFTYHDVELLFVDV